MSLLRAQMTLELSQALLHGLLSRALARVDVPVRLLRFPLGRLQRGELRRLELGPDRLDLELRFAGGPALELSAHALAYLAERETLRLRVERLHFSGFGGAPVLNLVPGRVVEMLAAQADRRLPGLLTPGRNMELELHLRPLLARALGESPLRKVFQEYTGTEPSPAAQVRDLRLLEGLLRVELSADG